MDEKLIELKHQAELLHEQGQFTEAESIWRDIVSKLRLLSSETGTDLEFVRFQAETFEAAGKTVYSQQRFTEAEGLYKRALEIRRQRFGPISIDLTPAMNQLAELYYEQSRFEEAEEICRNILNIYEKAIAGDHAHIGEVSSNLAFILTAQNRFEESIPFFKKALRIQTKELSVSHPQVINLLENYANVLRHTGRSDEADHLKACAMGRVSGVIRAMFQ